MDIRTEPTPQPSGFNGSTILVVLDVKTWTKTTNVFQTKEEAVHHIERNFTSEEVEASSAAVVHDATRHKCDDMRFLGQALLYLQGTVIRGGCQGLGSVFQMLMCTRVPIDYVTICGLEKPVVHVDVGGVNNGKTKFDTHTLKDQEPPVAKYWGGGPLSPEQDRAKDEPVINGVVNYFFVYWKGILAGLLPDGKVAVEQDRLMGPLLARIWDGLLKPWCLVDANGPAARASQYFLEWASMDKAFYKTDVSDSMRFTDDCLALGSKFGTHVLRMYDEVCRDAALPRPASETTKETSRVYYARYCPSIKVKVEILAEVNEKFGTDLKLKDTEVKQGFGELEQYLNGNPARGLDGPRMNWAEGAYEELEHIPHEDRPGRIRDMFKGLVAEIAGRIVAYKVAEGIVAEAAMKKKTNGLSYLPLERGTNWPPLWKEGFGPVGWPQGEKFMMQSPLRPDKSPYFKFGWPVDPIHAKKVDFISASGHLVQVTCEKTLEYIASASACLADEREVAELPNRTAKRLKF